MRQICRQAANSWRRRQLAMTELLRQARIVTDPNRLAHLSAEAEKHKGRNQGEPGRRQPT